MVSQRFCFLKRESMKLKNRNILAARFNDFLAPSEQILAFKIDVNATILVRRD